MNYRARIKNYHCFNFLLIYFYLFCLRGCDILHSSRPYLENQFSSPVMGLIKKIWLSFEPFNHFCGHLVSTQFWNVIVVFHFGTLFKFFLGPSLHTLSKTSWPASASKLYRPSDRRLWAKLVPTFADRECRVVSAADPHGRILGFLDRRRYCFFQVAPKLYSRGWVDPVPDPLLLRKSGSAGNRTRASGSVARNSNY
jgi:hypothetical protein